MGCHGTSAGEAQGSPDVISPAMYEKYCLPYAQKITRAVQNDDFFLSYHICGDTTKIIDRMAETGAAILEFDYKCERRLASRFDRGG